MLGYWLNRRRHGPWAFCDQLVPPVSMDLVSLKFRMLACRRETDDFAMSVYVAGKLKAFFDGKSEKFLEHADHIFVGMIVVIPQNDMIA